MSNGGCASRMDDPIGHNMGPKGIEIVSERFKSTICDQLIQQWDKMSD